MCINSYAFVSENLILKMLKYFSQLSERPAKVWCKTFKWHSHLRSDLQSLGDKWQCRLSICHIDETAAHMHRKWWLPRGVFVIVKNAGICVQLKWYYFVVDIQLGNKLTNSLKHKLNLKIFWKHSYDAWLLCHRRL